MSNRKIQSVLEMREVLSLPVRRHSDIVFFFQTQTLSEESSTVGKSQRMPLKAQKTVNDADELLDLVAGWRFFILFNFTFQQPTFL